MSRIYIYMIIMAVVTYLIRMLPLALIRREIKNKYIKSFLYYVPYVTLSVMVFPAILTATEDPISAIVGFVVALVAAYLKGSLFTVSILACVSVFITELIIL